MFLAFPSIHEVHSMPAIRARAEYLAWMTHDAYRDAGTHAHGLTRRERAISLWKARDYRRRAIRASNYANRHAPMVALSSTVTLAGGDSWKRSNDGAWTRVRRAA